MYTDLCVLSFDTKDKSWIDFLQQHQQNKDKFNLSELDKSHVIYNSVNKKVKRKGKSKHHLN